MPNRSPATRRDPDKNACISVPVKEQDFSQGLLIPVPPQILPHGVEAESGQYRHSRPIGADAVLDERQVNHFPVKIK